MLNNDNLSIINYNRSDAVKYALKWAFSRNPDYLDFHGLGGDCTNFVSQCIYAGCQVMNYTPVYGWYYLSSSDRTASWTGVEYLYKFLVSNKNSGPFAEEISLEKSLPGDIVQFGNSDYHFFHTAIITEILPSPSFENIFVASHSYDVDFRRIASYSFDNIRFLHIRGARIPI